MQWLSLSSAWFGLAALFIIAMYILKKRYEPKYVSSHLLWRQVLQEQEANRPWQRLKRQLLLWLQLIIALLIVTALMEPAIHKQLAVNHHAVLLLDRSASMATMVDEDGSTYLDTAKQEMIEWLQQEWGGGEVTLIVNGEYPQILANKTNNRQELEQLISSIEPYYGTSDDETALSLARALAGSSEQATLHYYVDERYKISSASLQSEGQGIEEWHLYQSLASAKDARIRSFSLSQEERSVHGFVTVLHEAASRTELELTVTAYNEKGEVLSEKQVKQPADASGITTFTMYDLPQGHYYEAKLLPSEYDPNPHNNKQYGLVHEDQVYQALLITEGNLFLEKALQLMNVGVTMLTAESAPPSAELLSSIHFIIVDGNYEKLVASNEWQQIMEKFPLWIYDHPAKSEQATLKNVTPVVNEHEVTQYFAMDDIYISSIKQFSEAELAGYDVLVQYGGVPALIAGFKQQQPFLRYAFALQDSDLPLRAVFPVLVMNSVDYLVSGSTKQLGYMTVNATPTLTMAANSSKIYWQQLNERRSTEKLNESNVTNGHIQAPSVPGVYTLVEQDEQGNYIQQRTAVVTADVTEFAAPSITSMITSQDSGWKQGEQNATGVWMLTPWLAAFILLMLLLEWEVYRRGI